MQYQSHSNLPVGRFSATAPGITVFSLNIFLLCLSFRVTCYNLVPMMDTNISELSERELEILRLIATGASNKEIAQQLFISTNTVRVHVRNIFAKISVGSRTEAAMYAVRIGLIESPAANLSVTPVVEPPLSIEVTPPTESKDPEIIQIPATQVSPLMRYGWLAFLALVLVVGLSFGLPALFNPEVEPTATSASFTPPAPTWVDLPPMLTARRGLASVILGDQIFTIAGETNQSISAVTESYNIAENAWEPLADKPTAVADVSGAVLGGLIYIPGGRIPNGERINNLEIYDPTADVWSQGAPLPKALSAYSLIAFEGQLYLFGGSDGQSVSSDVFIYNPSDDEWRIGTSMPTAREFAGPVAASGRIFLLGGKNETGLLSSCDYYFPNREGSEVSPWVGCANMPEPLFGMGVTGVADLIVIIGGQGESGRISSYQFAPQTGGWLKFELEPYSTWVGPSVIPLGSNMFLVGGEIDGQITAQASSYQMLFTVVLPIFK